jgi:hypothetical protein
LSRSARVWRTEADAPRQVVRQHFETFRARAGICA